MTSVVFVAVVLGPRVSSGAEFFVVPAAGSPSGDGSQARPWRTLEEVVAAGLIETRHWASLPYAAGATLEPVNPGAPVQPGDTIWLDSGLHGNLRIVGAYNAAPITIASLPGATPQFERVLLRSIGQWNLRGLHVSPSFGVNGTSDAIIDVDSHAFSGPSSDVTIEDGTIFTAPDILSWTGADWVARAVNGIESDADNITIRRNTVTNVRFAIAMSGDGARVSRNSIRNFSGDGIRGLGDDGTYEYNYIANSYDVDENHDDGFQSWSVTSAGVGTGEVRGLTFRGNVIINREDPNQPLSGPLQGIGCFDGFFTDWIIENNVVIVDHWHGITLLGVRNSRIVNNTVIDIENASLGPPWIKIAPHKNGTDGFANIVRNNFVTAMANEGASVTEDHNLVITDRRREFVNPSSPWDLHLLPDATAIDQGSELDAPRIDRDERARPQGAAFDVGAYEWQAATNPPDAGSPDLGFATDAEIADVDVPDVFDSGPMNNDDGGAEVDGGVLERPMVVMDEGCGCTTKGLGRPDPAGVLGLLFVGTLLARGRRGRGLGSTKRLY